MDHFSQLPDFRSMYPANRILEIPAGQTAALTSGDWDLIWIEGTLVIPRTEDISVAVREPIVTPTGFLDGGNAADPVMGNVEITFPDGPLDASDPSQWGKGFLGFGKINLHGKVKTPYVELMASPVVNDTDLAIQPPIDWQVGDMVAIPATVPNSASMYELRTITAIGQDYIGIDSPLTQDYPPCVDPNGIINSLGFVANMTRNICFKSANPAGVKGHLLCADRAQVDMWYTCFEQMGRTIGTQIVNGQVVTAPTDSTTFNPDGTVLHYGTNQIGRYSVHMHHLWGPTSPLPVSSMDWPGRPAPQFRLVGLAMLEGAKWGMSIHASHYGLIRKCVSIGFDGAGIISEDGSETANVFAENLSCVGLGDDHPDRYDHEGTSGACYWFRNNHNYYFDNIAAGGTEGTGFYIANSSDNNASANMPVPIPNFPGADMMDPAQFTMIPINQLPLLGWQGNLIYAAKKFGLGLWSLQNLDVAPVFGETTILNTDHTTLYLDYSSATFEDMTITNGLYGVRSHNPNHARSNGAIPLYPFKMTRYDIRGCGQAWSEDDRPCLDGIFQDGHCQSVKGFIISSQKEGYWPRKYQFINPTFSAMPGQPESFIETYLDPLWKGGSWAIADILNKIDIEVIGYAGNNFRLWFNEQAPDYVLTDQASGPFPDPYHDGETLITKTISAVPGQTNQFLWDNGHPVPLLELAPTGTTTLPGFVGLVDGNVTPPPQNPTASLSASPLTITQGESSTLTWSSTNGVSAELDGVSVNLSGSQSVSPTATQTYTLVVTGAVGTTPASASVTVTVNTVDDCQTRLAAALAKIADYEARFAAIKALALQIVSQIPAGI